MSYLLKWRQRLFIPSGQCVPIRLDYVNERLTVVPVAETPNDLLHRICFWTIHGHIEVG